MSIPRGNSGFKYTPPGGSLTTHTLRWPLEYMPGGIQAAHVMRRYVIESLDYSAIDVITIGTGVEEATFAIRYDNAPDTLKTMLRHGLNGVVLTYYPDLAVGGTSYAFRLMSIEGTGSGDHTGVIPDPDRMAFGEYSATIRVRMLSGSLDALL